MLIARLKREEAGFTLVEVLVASSLMLVVLSATLTTFNNFLNNNRTATNQNDQQELARRSIDQIVRQARNLANPVNGTPTVAYADPNAFIFQTTDPSKQWVRYCLDTTGAGASTTNGTIWYQTFTNGGAAGGTPPSSATCPDAAWTTTTKLLTNVTNATHTNPTAPVFQYLTFGSGTPIPTNPITPTSSPPSSAIARVIVSLFIDVEPTKPPGESQLSSGAYMRNQNQSPTARFVAIRGSGSTYTLDGGGSTDPEQRTLKYDWYEGRGGYSSFPPIDTATGKPADPATLPDCAAATPAGPSSPWNLKCIGTGASLFHDFANPPDSTAFPAGGPPAVNRVSVWLRVTDPGNLAVVTKPPPGLGDCLLTTDNNRQTDQCEGLPVG